jgi:transcription factor WhiB
MASRAGVPSPCHSGAHVPAISRFSSRAARAQAKAICASCPVIRECAGSALRHGERDREGDAEERTGLGQGERVGEDAQDADTADRGYRDTEGDAEQRTGLGSDPEGIDSGFSDAASEGSDAASSTS